MILAIIGVSIYNNENVNTIMHNFLNYLNLLVAPLGIVLGILYGYPLLKQKITESHITKQFDIIQDANRLVRIECLKLKARVEPETESGTLTIDYINNILKDVKRIQELSVDASSEVHTYADLLMSSIIEFEQLFKRGGIQKDIYTIQRYNHYIYQHILQLQYIAGLIKIIPSNNSIKRMNILVNEITPYVINNTYYTIEGLERSINLHPASASLISFVSNTLGIKKFNCLLALSTLKVVKTIVPIVRCMYYTKIYAPAILKGHHTKVDSILSDRFCLYLIGYQKCTTHLFKNQKEENRFRLFYANISNVGFVEGMINDVATFKGYEDDYINSPAFSQIDIRSFEKRGYETIVVEVLETDLNMLFIQNKIMLEEQMQTELKQ